MLENQYPLAFSVAAQTALYFQNDQSNFQANALILRAM